MIFKQKKITIEIRNFIAKINNDNRKNRFERCINKLYEHNEFQMITIVINLKISIRFSNFSIVVFFIDDLTIYFVFVKNSHIERFVSTTSQISNSINFSTKKIDITKFLKMNNDFLKQR